MLTAGELIHSWNSFFFNPVPVYSLALFRIIFGLVLLCDAVYNLMNIKEYLGPQGLIGFDRYKGRSGYAFSLFRLFPPTLGSAYAIVFIHIFFLLFLILGLLTQLSTFFVFLTLCSIVNRNPTICNGGDNVSRVMCFLLIFAPSGEVYSLDNLIFPSGPGTSTIYFQPWAVRLMQVQLSIIYIYTAYWKLKGATYRNGTALYYVVKNDLYKRFSVPEIVVRRPFVQVLTWGVLALEFALGFGLWVEDVRVPLLIGGFLLHLSIEYLLNVHFFSWYMMAALLLFIDPLTVDKYVTLLLSLA